MTIIGAVKSSRKDGRGHWPAGKRRSRLNARARNAFVLDLRRAVARKDSSIRSVARLLEVSDRTVRRWLSGEDWPMSEEIAVLGRRLAQGKPSA